MVVTPGEYAQQLEKDLAKLERLLSVVNLPKQADLPARLSEQLEDLALANEPPPDKARSEQYPTWPQLSLFREQAANWLSQYQMALAKMAGEPLPQLSPLPDNAKLEEEEIKPTVKTPSPRPLVKRRYLVLILTLLVIGTIVVYLLFNFTGY